MNRTESLIAVVGFLIVGLGAVAQESSAPPATTGSNSTPAASISTVRGCLEGQRGNYIMVEDKTGLVYVLKGVGNKLDGQLRHEVEVKGRLRSGLIKTGVSPSKSGSNPSDTAHGVDGVPLEVADVQTDVARSRSTAKLRISSNRVGVHATVSQSLSRKCASRS
jgi:hypothetical protein